MASRWNAVSESIATRPQRKMGIKVGGERLAPQTAHIFAQSFPQNPVLTYILTPHFPTLRERKAFLPRYFRVLCLAATLNHGIFVLAGEEVRLQPLSLYTRGDGEEDVGRGDDIVRDIEKEIVPECAALLLPPGAKVDSLGTLWKSGFLGLAWDIGIRAYSFWAFIFAGVNPFDIYIKLHQYIE
ncbi:hypothetical protein HYFRA_00006533 [Hymenoscyphus fraxineus]|uniref:Uncharacterized protein n=1 Tax=Hymenoscyphus fraxineus TaxID=746836 RepID=A0A9N9KS49_9HELO|nr:hypothetical protein HYFRA_00006533 [Hymenoscyphus fraxineus]